MNVSRVDEQTYQQRAVTDSLLALSYWNFHKGRSVPSWSLNLSDTSSKYLKSENVWKEWTGKEEKKGQKRKENMCSNLNIKWHDITEHTVFSGTYLVLCRQMYSDWPSVQRSWTPCLLSWCHHSMTETLSYTNILYIPISPIVSFEDLTLFFFFFMAMCVWYVWQPHYYQM